MSEWKDLVPVGFGWLLGILSTLVYEGIRSWNTKRAVSAGLKIELGQLRCRLGSIVYKLTCKLGQVDPDVIKWLRGTLQSSGGGTEFEGLRASLERISGQEEAFAQIERARCAEEQSIGRGAQWGNLSLPFLEANLQVIHGYPATTQAEILGIRTQAGFLSQNADELRELNRMTFDSSITPENRERVQSNIRELWRFTAELARRVADRIGKLKL